jgi:hypothetical protein
MSLGKKVFDLVAKDVQEKKAKVEQKLENGKAVAEAVIADAVTTGATRVMEAVITAQAAAEVAKVKAAEKVRDAENAARRVSYGLQKKLLGK